MFLGMFGYLGWFLQDVFIWNILLVLRASQPWTYFSLGCINTRRKSNIKYLTPTPTFPPFPRLTTIISRAKVGITEGLRGGNVSKLMADNVSVGEGPVVVANGSPGVVVEHLHTALAFVRPAD